VSPWSSRVILCSKVRFRRNFRFEAKWKRNFFRFDAKEVLFFACFASMQNEEI
jgi:hypothetical protein